MTAPRWSKTDALFLAPLMAIAACVFLAGITWGLPSHNADPYLFGDHPVWSGADILRLAPEPAADESRGADVDVNPITDRRHPVLLNGTDAQRAEIVRRYRLYSYQPDEMITFKSLSGMHPGRLDLDPRLYQYGGLWIYPVGGLLKLCSLLHLVDVRPDKAWYLDHPEEFGRFYVVARAYSAAWALAGVFAVYWITKRLTGGRAEAAAASLLYVAMPVVINMAHEAKPHMAGAVLMLYAVAAGTKYAETGLRRWWLATGVLCGAAFGMVISGVLAFAVLPAMAMLRKDPWRRRTQVVLLTGVCGVLTYLLTNPYIWINLIRHPERLRSNLGNSTAMYAPSLAGVGNAASLISQGASPVVAVVGTIGVLALLAVKLWRWRAGVPGRKREGSDAPTWLLLAVAILVAVQFVILAAGKPGEYGRFALLVDIALAIAVVAAANAFVRRDVIRRVLLAFVVMTAVPFGCAYLRGFVRDSATVTSRLAAAEDLRGMPGAIGLYDEPAPYLMPPVNVFERQLILLPKGKAVDPAEVPVDFRIEPVEDMGHWLDGHVFLPSNWPMPDPFLLPRISWADKRFELVPIRGFRAGGGATRTTLADSGPR